MNPSISQFRSPSGEATCRGAYEAAMAAWPVPYQQLDVSTGFGCTHLIVSGPEEAPPILLLHGNLSSANNWSDLITGLSQGYRTYCIDIIDEIGLSRPSRLPKSRADYNAWLFDVSEQIKTPRFDVIGCSKGGSLAVNFAISHPDRLNHMVLLAPGIANLGKPTVDWALYGAPMVLFPSRLTVKRFIQRASTQGYIEGNPVFELMIAGAKNLKSLVPYQPSYKDEELRQVRTPTLLLIGDREILYEPRKAIERAGQLLPDLRTHIVPDAGHFLTMDQPVVVNRLIQDFLR